MKKLMALLLAVVMVLGLCACASSDNTPATTQAPAATEKKGIRQRFQCGADDMRPAGRTCQADQCAARIGIPIGCSKTGECRDEIHAACIRHTARNVL